MDSPSRGSTRGAVLANVPSFRYLGSRNTKLSGPVLRDTARLSQRYPPIARYGVFGVSTWPIGCDTPPPFLSVSPLESMRSGGAIPPLKRGISAILARYPMKTRVRYCS